MSDTKATAPIALDMRRILNAPRARVFAAWTTPELLRQFLAPGDLTVPEIEMEVRVGGAYRVTMQRPNGERVVVGGVYREISTPERIVCTWKWEEDDPTLETLLTLEFLDRGEQTEVVLTHENFSDVHERARHEHGWTGAFEKLASVVESGPTGIAFIMYPVTDIPRSVAFYRDTLGLRMNGMNEAWWVEFEVGGVTFGVGNMPTNGEPGTAQSLVLEVADLVRYRARLAERGVESSEPQRTPYNCTISMLRDPDGNTVWLHERP